MLKGQKIFFKYLTLLSVCGMILSSCASAVLTAEHATSYDKSIEQILSYEKDNTGSYRVKVVGELDVEGFGIYEIKISKFHLMFNHVGGDREGSRTIHARRRHLTFISDTLGINEELLLDEEISEPFIKDGRLIVFPGWDNGYDVVVVLKNFHVYDNMGRTLLPLSILIDLVTLPFQFVWLLFSGVTV